ncbi:MAG: trypsin-like peptidase domain-containing protein [Planctomycetales bacterium]|nr:trypsin-like peptidase domain-containing protein [Planctomycetales bacterium]
MNLMRWMGLAGTLSIAAGVAIGAWLLPTRTPVAPAETLDSLRAKQVQIRDVIERVMPSTVVISDGVGSGSGVIVSEEGLVLTAAHVLLTDGPLLEVTFADGRKVPAKPLGMNLDVDAAMLQLQEPGPWPAVELAEAGGAKPGDWCVALGHPGGYQLGRTPPVRVGRVLANDPTVVLTDCALIGGDSGGPLFDLEGNLIGIHSSIGESIDQNRHVPIGAFRADWDRMLDGESWGRLGRLVDLTPNRPMLGVRLEFLREDAVVVSEVIDDSPAANAGVEVGDRILSVDDDEVSSPMELIQRVAQKQVGQRVRLLVERAGKLRRLEVVLTRSGELDLRD